MKIFNIYLWTKILHFPIDLYRETKWFIQRGKRGFSDRDVWDVDFYLSKIIPQMLKQLRETQTILPTWDYGNEPEELAQKRWNTILDDIIYTFETEYKLSESDLLYATSKNRNKLEKTGKDIGIPVMTKKECERYRKGWYYFQKHFKSLWD